MPATARPSLCISTRRARRIAARSPVAASLRPSPCLLDQVTHRLAMQSPEERPVGFGRWSQAKLHCSKVQRRPETQSPPVTHANGTFRPRGSSSSSQTRPGTCIELGRKKRISAGNDGWTALGERRTHANVANLWVTNWLPRKAFLPALPLAVHWIARPTLGFTAATVIGLLS